jgi:TetR/AcrR family transcriptional regulator, transcriptional repressor for nem operon
MLHSCLSCLPGSMLQETFATAPRSVMRASPASPAMPPRWRLSAAIATHGAPAGVTAHGLALHTQAVLQGAFILAKGKDDPRLAVE